MEGTKLWLWKNFVDGRPEYWAFDNPYPCGLNGDPLTLGSPCGYAIVKHSGQNGRPEVTDAQVLEEIKLAQAEVVVGRPCLKGKGVQHLIIGFDPPACSCHRDRFVDEEIGG